MFLTVCLSEILQAQSFITGTVSSDDHYISNALVYNTVNKKRTYTSSKGKFVIEGEMNDELRFVKEGYERYILKIKNNSDVEVRMVKIPTEIEEIKVRKLTGNLTKDAQRMKIDNSIEKLKNNIGLPKPKENYREKVPTVVNDVILPLFSLAPTIKIQEIYSIISGDSRRQKALFKYEDLQKDIKWIRERLDNDFFIRNNIPNERINEFLEFAIVHNPNIQNGIKQNNVNNVSFELLESIDIFTSRIQH